MSPSSAEQRLPWNTDGTGKIPAERYQPCGENQFQRDDEALLVSGNGFHPSKTKKIYFVPL
jgi:hypothetical protein